VGVVEGLWGVGKHAHCCAVFFKASCRAHCGEASKREASRSPKRGPSFARHIETPLSARHPPLPHSPLCLPRPVCSPTAGKTAAVRCKAALLKVCLMSPHYFFLPLDSLFLPVHRTNTATLPRLPLCRCCASSPTPRPLQLELRPMWKSGRRRGWSAR